MPIKQTAGKADTDNICVGQLVVEHSAPAAVSIVPFLRR
jgi:hypothetical protein